MQTPPVGIGLTHRVAVHLQPGLTPPANATPRAQVEPAVDAWLEGILPTLSAIGCTVAWTDPVGGGPEELPVTLADLGIHPLDLLTLVNPDELQAMTELDDRVLRRAIATADPRPDAELEIRYLSPPPGGLTVFETASLVRSLKTIVTQSRPLRATDGKLQIAAAPEQDADVFVDRDRIAKPAAQLDALGVDIGTFLATLGPLVADPIANRDLLVSGGDAFAAEAVDLLERAARFNLPLSGWGFVFAARHDMFDGLLGAVRDLVSRWDAKLADFDARIVAYDDLPFDTPEDERLKALRAAELVVSTSFLGLPSTTLRPALNGKRDAFAQRRDAFADVLASPGSSFAATVAAVRALLPVDELDSQPLDPTPFEDAAVILAEDIARTLSGHAAEVESRSNAVHVQLDAHDAAASPAAKAQALQTAALALLGEDAVLVPEFGLAPDDAAERANAVGASESLLDFLKTEAKVDFPVDEWLYGAARVRPMLRAWETTVLLAEAFERPEPALLPIQLPFQAGASWLALQFPPSAASRLRPAALHRALRDAVRRERTSVRAARRRVDGGDSRHDARHGDHVQLRPAGKRGAAVDPARHAGDGERKLAVGRPRRRAQRDARPGEKPAVEPVHVDATPYTRFLPATIMAATLYNISIATTLAAANGALQLVEARDA